jgi:hypothetical protein
MVSVELAADYKSHNSADGCANDRRFRVAPDSLADNGPGSSANNKTANLSAAGLGRCQSECKENHSCNRHVHQFHKILLFWMSNLTVQRSIPWMYQTVTCGVS